MNTTAEQRTNKAERTATEIRQEIKAILASIPQEYIDSALAAVSLAIEYIRMVPEAEAATVGK